MQVNSGTQRRRDEWHDGLVVSKIREHGQFEKTRWESVDRSYKVGGNRYVTLMDTGNCGSLPHQKNRLKFILIRTSEASGLQEEKRSRRVIGCFDSLEAVNGNY